MVETGILLLLLLLLSSLGFLIWRLVAGRARTRRGWLGRFVVVTLSSITLIATAGYLLMNARTFQFFGEIVPAVITTQPLVALTFDDGPSPYTEEILALLAKKEVHATFFLVGQNIEKFPAATAAVLAAGHEIGNHSYTHQRMILKSWDFIRSEIERTDQLIQDAGYTNPIHFRSPYGKKFLLLPRYLSQVHKKNILFDVEPESYGDVIGDADKIVAHILARAKPGSIILLHPENQAWQPSRQAIPLLIDALQAKGYRFVTVSELIAAAE